MSKKNESGLFGSSNESSSSSELFTGNTTSESSGLFSNYENYNEMRNITELNEHTNSYKIDDKKTNK